MPSTTQYPIAEIDTFVTSKQNRCLVGVTRNPSPCVISRTVSDFAEKLAYILYEEKYLHTSNLDVYLANELLKILLSNKSFIEVIKSSCNLEALLKFSGALTYSRQRNYEYFLKTIFYPFWEEMMNWNIASNTFVKEKVLSAHFPSIRDLQKTEAISWMNEINCSDFKNDIIGQPSVPALDFVKGDSNVKKKLTLLCVLTNESNYDETVSCSNKICGDEDIRMILTDPWHNVVVTHNALTISDENNQHLPIFFRDPLEVKFCHKDSNPRRKFRFNNSMAITNVFKNRVQSGRMRKINSLQKPTTVDNQDIDSCNKQDDRVLRMSPKQVGKKKIENVSFLDLGEPILLNYVKQNKTKQVLMYKAHSAENVWKDKSKSNSLKILEKLLAKSVEYKGESVHLIFEPLETLTRLKKETRDLEVAHHTKCKCGLVRSCIYKKLLQYKNTQNFRNARSGNETFGTVLLKNECEKKNTSEMPSQSVFITQNLPHNFCTSFTKNLFNLNERTVRNKITDRGITTTLSCLDLSNTNYDCLNLPKNFFDMNGSMVQAEYATEMSQKTITAMNTYLDISEDCSSLNSPKSFSTPVERKKIYVDELFPENESKLKPGRRIGRTALKQVNVRQIVSSVFKHFFHFYSLHSGKLRSGAVITRSNSNHWLQVAGVVTDSCTQRIAGDIFATVAGRKVVLNIFDYIKFLATFAKTRRLIVVELVKQMMVCEQPSELEYGMVRCKRCEPLQIPENKPEEFHYEDKQLPISRSLPNFWNTDFKIMPPRANSSAGHRNYFNREIV